MLPSTEEVIYSTDDYLSSVRTLFHPVIIYELLKKIIAENRILIENQIALLTSSRYAQCPPRIVTIEPFHKAKDQSPAARLYASSIPCETGLRIELEGGLECCAVIFHVVDSFIQRHPIALMRLTGLQHYMYNKYCGGFPALVFPWNNEYSMIKYAKRCSRQLLDAMTQGEYGISRNVVPSMANGNNYETLLTYREYFKRFLKEKEVRVLRMQITQQSIYYLSDPDNNIQFRERLRDFLLTFDLSYHPVSVFRDEFEAATFMAHYAHQLKGIELVRDLEHGGKIGGIASINYLCDQDTVEHNIEELYHSMHKNYKLVPTLVRPPADIRFRLLARPFMLSAPTLRQKVHIINDKFKIIVRSFGSIHRNEETVMFLVHELEQCQEFRAMLAENGISEGSFKDWIRGERGERYLEYLTEKSRYFDSAIAWHINMQTKNKDRIVRDLEYFFNIRYRDVMDIKIVIPPNSEELVDFLFPIFMQKLLELTRFSDCGLIKTVEFIVSCSEDARIREALRREMHRLNGSRCIKIHTFSPLELSLFSVEKMVELKYFTVAYWPRDQFAKMFTLSPLNSMVFVHEATKMTGTRKIILSLRTNPRSIQYIMNIHLEKVFSSGPEGIREEVWSGMGAQMCQVVGLVRKFCPNMDMLVLYGEAGMGSVEMSLFYCEIKDGDRQGFMTKMDVNFQEQKVSLNKQIVFILRSKPNEEHERFVVEMHEKYADDFRKVIRAASKTS